MSSRLVATSLTVLVLTALAGCGSDPEPSVPQVTQPPTTQEQQPTPSDSPDDNADDNAGPRATGTVVDGLEVPWGMDFLPNGDAVVTERESGRVLRVTPDGDLTRLGVVEQAAPQGESGLLGVAVSPDFPVDRWLYLYVTTAEDNRVLRVELQDDELGEPDVILDGIPAGFIHDGGRLAFGPEGFLYVTTGETGDPELAQELDSLAGKILRITPDGKPAPGNPDPKSPVWTSGHRNVQGLAWDDEGRLWASEFGDSTWDELNLIQKGGNYGWPLVEGTGGGELLTDPELVWAPEDASPSGLAFADGHLWMGALRGQRLWRIDVSAEGKASDPQEFLSQDYGRLRTVVPAPDGSLWVATSNRDGRGNPTKADDRIVRVIP